MLIMMNQSRNFLLYIYVQIDRWMKKKYVSNDFLLFHYLFGFNRSYGLDKNKNFLQNACEIGDKCTNNYVRN